MPPRLRPTLLGVAVLLSLASRAAGAEAPSADAAPSGKNCLGEARTKLLVSEGLYAQSNPSGLENQLQLGVCTPLVRQPGLLFDYSNAQAGIVLMASPVYAMPGAFVSVAPLSILELRAEAEGVTFWRIGMDGAGYFPRSSPDEQFEDLPADLAQSATGYTAAFTGTLQAELELAPGLALVAVDSASYAYWSVGEAPWYYHPRYDLVMARHDWVGRNTALLLAGRQLSRRLVVRAGVTDELTWVASSGYRQNVLAALGMAVLSGWPGQGHETVPFVRVGTYTEHAHRGGLQLIGGVSMTFDVTPGRAPGAR